MVQRSNDDRRESQTLNPERKKITSVADNRQTNQSNKRPQQDRKNESPEKPFPEEVKTNMQNEENNSYKG
jgi:hypothetical protein